MKILEGLQPFEAVKKDCKLIVQLPQGTYMIDCVEKKLPYNGMQVVVHNGKDIFLKSVRKGKLVGYSYKDERFSVDLVESLKQEINKYLDEDGDYTFHDLDTEYNIRKKCEWVLSARPLFEDDEVAWEPVEINVVGVWEDTGSDFIETPYHVGNTNWMGGTGVYKVHLSGIAQCELSKWCKDNDKVCKIPDHSHLEYVKIDDKYVFASKFKKDYICKTNIVRITDSLTDAKEIERNLRKDINKHLNSLFDTSFPDKATVAEIYETLAELRESVSRIQVKAKSPVSTHSVRQTITNLIDKL